MKKVFLSIFFLFLFLFFTEFSDSISVVSFNVSVSVSSFNLVINSPLNLTYNNQNVSFEIFSNNNISFCKYSLDGWHTNSSLNKVNDALFSNFSFLDQGSYFANFWCNNTVGEVNDGMGVWFAVFLPPVSPSGSGGGGARRLPQGNETNEIFIVNQSLSFNGSFVGCERGICDVDNKMYCGADAFWKEQGYCEVCSHLDLDICETLGSSCGNEKCERYLEENLFNCFKDCRTDVPGEFRDSPVLSSAVLIVHLIFIYVLYLVFFRNKHFLKKHSKKD